MTSSPSPASSRLRRDIRIHIVVERHDGWYVAYVPELPGVHSQERTPRAARANLMAALRELVAMDPRAVRPRPVRVEKLRLHV
ncbi:MAG: type II toxin-antitoxin system HicB family antitoxin [Planctomycetes bacterium]|nr:type II toxin-antitoxin system HicB family antitoxin [Planctomycetota bacterium]